MTYPLLLPHLFTNMGWLAWEAQFVCPVDTGKHIRQCGMFPIVWGIDRRWGLAAGGMTR